MVDRNLCPEHRGLLMKKMKDDGLLAWMPPALGYIPKFLVITEVPVADGTSDVSGFLAANDDNMSDELAYEHNGILYIGEDFTDDITNGPSRWAKRQVFYVGEMIIVNDLGREVCGHGRKPSKWNVKYEEFDSLEDAIRKAGEIRRRR